ncbi:MAG: hypothetical protein RL624_1129 [Bacteroidota bacterium]|jgi:hypothetical protein
MKNTLLAALVAFLFMTSCTQQNTPSPSNNNNGGGSTTGYTVDSSYFFKVNFQNKALYNYGVFTSISVGSIIFQGGPYCTIGTSTTNGITSSVFENVSLVNSLFINHATCNASWVLIKNGSSQGIYKANNIYDTKIIDLTTSKTYIADTSSTNINVSNVGLHNVTGTFTCKLIDGTTLIPASGSFNLYK